MKHAFRNALIPLVTIVALNFGALLGGAVVTETIFALDGMGLYFITKLNAGDPYPVMAFLWSPPSSSSSSICSPTSPTASSTRGYDLTERPTRRPDALDDAGPAAVLAPRRSLTGRRNDRRYRGADRT